MRKFVVVGLAMVFAMSALAQYQGSPSRLPNNWKDYQQYRGRLSPGDQSRYDSYFDRWTNAKKVNDQDQVTSMEKRMQDIMRSYNIPWGTPYEALSSSYSGNYGGGNWYNGWSGRFNAHDQNVYDQLYVNWLQARSINAREQIGKAENAMQTVMRKYGIPANTDYSSLASPGIVQQWGYTSGLRIITATYGSGYRRVDVSGRLQTLVQNGRLSIRVTNDAMGGDPAPKQKKSLDVTYSVNNGRTSRRSVYEGGYLNIP
ncbi:MAG: hypothetical protein H0X25_05385 [Acidobacteriales bacterium]|nr:hypothetical protein [Terriglobales bacterium]